jgi:hypothetical protein
MLIYLVRSRVLQELSEHLCYPLGVLCDIDVSAIVTVLTSASYLCQKLQLNDLLSARAKDLEALRPSVPLCEPVGEKHTPAPALHILCKLAHHCIGALARGMIDNSETFFSVLCRTRWRLL